MLFSSNYKNADLVWGTGKSLIASYKSAKNEIMKSNIGHLVKEKIPLEKNIRALSIVAETIPELMSLCQQRAYHLFSNLVKQEQLRTDDWRDLYRFIKTTADRDSHIKFLRQSIDDCVHANGRQALMLDLLRWVNFDLSCIPNLSSQSLKDHAAFFNLKAVQDPDVRVRGISLIGLAGVSGADMNNTIHALVGDVIDQYKRRGWIHFYLTENDRISVALRALFVERVVISSEDIFAVKPELRSDKRGDADKQSVIGTSTPDRSNDSWATNLMLAAVTTMNPG